MQCLSVDATIQMEMKTDTWVIYIRHRRSQTQ